MTTDDRAKLIKRVRQAADVIEQSIWKLDRERAADIRTMCDDWQASHDAAVEACAKDLDTRSRVARETAKEMRDKGQDELSRSFTLIQGALQEAATAIRALKGQP